MTVNHDHLSYPDLLVAFVPRSLRSEELDVPMSVKVSGDLVG
jgi:hypothetical protein